MPQPEDAKAEDQGAGSGTLPPNALDQALEDLLEKESFAPHGYAAPPDDLAASAPEPPPPPSDGMDPLNPSAEVWVGLEQAAKQEKEAEFNEAHHHRLVPPEELPDISNL